MVRIAKAKGKQREYNQSMKNKYVFAKHQLPHFFDPVTGILRKKEEYAYYQKIDEMREKQLVQELMRQKVARLDFEDARSDDLKEFMNVWNEVTLSTPCEVIKRDSIRVKVYLQAFLDRYCDHESIYIQASFANRKQLFLAHLLNLYNLSLLTSREMLEFKLEMDQRVPCVGVRGLY